MTPRIKDVAAAAGVSVGTVSHVLNKPHLVADPTRERVQQAIARLGFVRNESARQLRSGASRAVGLVVIDASNPFFMDVARGVEDEVQASGSVVLLGNSAGDAGRERHYLELFEQQRVRGVLIAPTGQQPPDLSGLRRLGIPVVLLDRQAAGVRLSTVAVDDVAGGRLAVAHLLEHGRRRIAFVGGPPDLAQVRDRRTGAQLAIDGRRGARLLPFEVPALTLQAGREAGDRIAALPPRRRPDAVFAANDLVAIGLLQRVLAHGLAVPGDLAIVGYDDIEFAAAGVVPLSSVRQPRADLGRQGARFLFEEIEAAQAGRRFRPRHVQFEPELVVRAVLGVSTATDASQPPAPGQGSAPRRGWLASVAASRPAISSARGSRPPGSTPGP